MTKTAFLYPYARYHGEVTPGNLVFNANLQEFAQRVSLIVGLETGGKLSPHAAYEQIEALWEQLERSQERLKIVNHYLGQD